LYSYKSFPITILEALQTSTAQESRKERNKDIRKRKMLFLSETVSVKVIYFSGLYFVTNKWSTYTSGL
jgi:hypothetical protein